MRDEAYIICPNCGREYRTERELRALWINSRYCITPGCGYDLSQLGDDEDVWMDWFADGDIDGKMR